MKFSSAATKEQREKYGTSANVTIDNQRAMIGDRVGKEEEERRETALFSRPI